MVLLSVSSLVCVVGKNEHYYKWADFLFLYHVKSILALYYNGNKPRCKVKKWARFHKEGLFIYFDALRKPGHKHWPAAGWPGMLVFLGKTLFALG